MDMKTGKIVDEIKEDQMLVALYDPALGTDAAAYAFQRVLRSDFAVQKINLLFGCNAALLKIRLGVHVLWPKDWMTQVMPAMGKDKWYYIVHERLEPPPQDDLKDPVYSGETILVLSFVPIQCESIDLKTWLLFGVMQDFQPLQQLKKQIDVIQKKKRVVKQKVAALPSMDVEGTPEQQAEIRKKLADAISTHAARFDRELETLHRKRKHIEKFLKTGPVQLALFPDDLQEKQQQQSTSIDEVRVETRTWMVEFTSSRGQELASVAMDKRDWNYVCLVQTRPEPKAFLEDDQVQHDIISAKDLTKEINMRTVRLRRLKHGEGEYMAPVMSTESKEKPLSPWDDDFHISSIGAVYSGECRLGEKHGTGMEYTNAGVYEGEFAHNARVGTENCRKYEYAEKCKDREYTSSLLNGDTFRDGVPQGEWMRITFPDGATCEGEMRDGKVTDHGTYTSSTGVVDEGWFQDGLLHGDACSRRFPDGTLQQGAFEHGQLHGRGRYVERNGDSYDGFFDHSVKHGRATSVFPRDRAKHVGFWHENTMNGRGDFYYRHDSMVKSKSEAHQESDDNQDEDDAWDFWYEGSFLENATVARHRHEDVHQRFPHHMLFTTNGKSTEKMALLTNILPPRLRKREARAKTNALRRQTREQEYRETREFANLTQHYAMLDAFYEKWTAKKKNAKLDEDLDAEQLQKVQEEHAAMVEFDANRAKFRKEKYDLSPSSPRDLREFEASLERITLTEHTTLERARIAEWTQLTSAIRKAQSQGRQHEN
ncbi:hypothetical protein FI667_g6682, partial [Globisporangium splendens]